VLAGTTNGYRVYTTDPFNKQSESREGDVSSLEMLFSTSLVALTLSPRVLRIQNTKVLHPPPRSRSITNPAKRHSTICEMTFRTAILAMRLNRKRLVVVLESELYIYDISNMQMLKTEKTSPNPNGSYVILPPPYNTNRPQQFALSPRLQRTTTSYIPCPQKPHRLPSNRPRMRHPSRTMSLRLAAKSSYTMLQSLKQ
jgi:hypothetical protein